MQRISNGVNRAVIAPAGAHGDGAHARPAPPFMQSAALAADLRAHLRGEVRFDDGSRALYATDGSNYRQTPIGVVLPRDRDDLLVAVAAARRYGAPLLGRGGGTSLAGQCCNEAVVLDCSKYMNRILALDHEHRRARVEPGVVLDDLRAAAEKYHLTFGPDPATHTHCTLGGMIGNNSCGIHSVMAGKTVDNVETLEVLTYDGLRLTVGPTSEAELARLIADGGRRGQIYAGLKRLRDKYAGQIRERYPKIPRRVSGYNLDQLLPENGFNVARALVGSESTCVIVLEAGLRLVESPPGRALLVLGYPDVYAAGDHTPEVLAHGPIGLEGLDGRLISDMKKKGMHPQDVKLLPEGDGWLLVEFGGQTRDEAAGRARELMEALKQAAQPPSMKLFDDRQEEKMIWTIRESGLGATAMVPGANLTWPGWEDSAVPPDKVGGYLRDLRHLLDRYGYGCDLYGHFGQGCIHTRIDFDLRTAKGIAHYRDFVSEAAEMVVRYGGSLSGEHGDGQARGSLLPKMFGQELMQAFREFKTLWDPDWKMNPGKVVDAYAVDQNLRLGTHYEPWTPATHFSFPEDAGSFAGATLRCVGVGECRRHSGGTMCPSYRVTREEQHSTRGRARLLFEMLQGQVIGRNGWRDESVKQALDLCLACKGCKGDCPVNVDMATYKAEFLSHYYAGRPRPRSGYSFGFIHWWARLAALAPGLANLATQTPVLRQAAKAVAGMAPQRSIPAFAPRTFQAWFRQRAPHNVTGAPVLLWPDTFNNYFHPETAKAAVEVLEAAGYRVVVPQAALCCGRPLYDYGFLDQAGALLEHILSELRQSIEAGVPLVGLEPSCVAVFRDEMVNLLPHNQDARRLSQQSYTLSEFLTQQAPDFQWPRLTRRALVHAHCHHKAVLDFKAEQQAMDKLGLDWTVLDSGCCGMAGSFGFEPDDHYAVSVKAGELVLLPAVRQAAADTLIIADGFSCRTQIEQLTGRRALHLAQVMQLALRQTPLASPPEQTWLVTQPRANPAPAALALGGLALLAGGWLWQRRRARKGEAGE